ncbi:DUF4105 domain-containing protein [Bizionia sediminis]|uniref:DUF4105 domain-containing protein n=1 Tax=Bizionia sediminis TaxID=1737064 RepID=A0ABW5KN32_9FLAO
MKNSLLLVIAMLCLHTMWGQTLSKQAEISVLTIGPGPALNDAFGHNAFRIKDRANDLDVTFDYGRFPFNEPGFYLNFALGKLNYSIGKSNFKEVKEFYTWQNRRIEEQVLNLTPQQKQTLFNYLLNNNKPQNRAYQYDFFYDNCATKMRDVLKIVLKDSLIFNTPSTLKPHTFRSLIREKVPTNTWGSLGIDIALGSLIDQAIVPENYMFLPEYIHTFFSNAKVGSKALVVSKETLYTPKPQAKSSGFLWSPYAVFGFISIVILWLTYADFKNQKRQKTLDILLLTTTTFVGILVLFLWFGTDHQATAYNYNLLWAFPLNGLLAWQLVRNRPKAWVIPFLKFLVIMLVLMVFHWVVGVQNFAYALLPLVIALAVRYVYLIQFFSKINLKVKD